LLFDHAAALLLLAAQARRTFVATRFTAAQ
jgi:hypothetical protein